MPDPIEPPSEDVYDDDVHAGELALGVLTGEDRAAALRRVIAEPDFAARVDAWRLRLAPLMDGIAEVPAPEGTWAGIERAIGTAAQVALGRWRAAAMTATAIAAGLAAVIVLRPDPAPRVIVQQSAPMLAQLAGAEGAMLVTAQYDAMSGRLRVRTANMPTGELVPELWVIAGDAVPRSLGFVPTNGASTFATPEAMRRMMADGVTIAVTMEPRSDTPHAAPTGAVLGKATLTAV